MNAGAKKSRGAASNRRVAEPDKQPRPLAPASDPRPPVTTPSAARKRRRRFVL